MMGGNQLDCVVIGYYEVPFGRYESILSNYGEDSEVYRDLKFSFINLSGRKLDFVSLMNYAIDLSSKDHKRRGLQQQLKSGDIPNLAAVYLTNFLINHGWTAEYINLFEYEKDKLVEYLAEDPLCVAITTTFYVVNLPVTEMVEFIRSNNRKVKIVVGGPLISNHFRNYQPRDFEAALRDIGADIYVVEGQGELTLSRIVDCLSNGGRLDSVPNVVYLEGDQVRRTMLEAENNSLDENIIDWRRFVGAADASTIQTRTARSCAFKCAFCNYPTRAGALTLASLDFIERELDSIRDLSTIRNVVFIDDTFNVPLPRFKDICRLMIRKRYPLGWFSYFRCSNSDEEAVDLMAESGCKGVFLGIESGSPTILKNMNKAATIEKYAQGIEMLRNRGILTFGSFIVGFPGETSATIEETAAFIKESRLDYYRAQLWYCEAGTPIQRDREKYTIEGDGFVWSHASMDSLEAMDHIERMFLTIDGPIWLPQWSFDFWIIPYLLGKGISFDRLRSFMGPAQKLLCLEIASVPEQRKNSLQQAHLQTLASVVKDWF